MIYPWHQATWQQLVTHLHTRPNAWLLYGKEYIGKHAFARQLAQTLLCENLPPNGTPCNHCPSCHLFLQNSHPDFYLLSPEQTEDNQNSTRKLQQIKINNVRTILEPLNRSSIRGGLRVVLVEPAETLNTQAANAMLKILEEPPQAVIFILVTHNRDRLLPTIKSRCRPLALPAPTHVQALQYLQQNHHNNEYIHALLAFHGDAPLFPHHPEQDALREKFLTILTTPRLLSILDYAAEFDKSRFPLALLFNWLGKWLVDMALTQQHITPIYYPDYALQLNQAAENCNPATLFRFQDALNSLTPYGYHSLNVRMQTEFLLSEYLLLVQKRSSSQPLS